MVKRILKKFLLPITKIMTKKGTKTEAKYKQVAFETAVRNPERYLRILSVVKDYENRILDDSCLLEIVSNLYLVGEFTGEGIKVSETTTIKDIKDTVIKINSTRKADGGFPEGYASRFWTYMRTPSELGMVYARYNESFKISEIVKMLIKGEIDEQEAFSIQAVRYNRKSPYRNVSNDFNFFRLTLSFLLSLREKNKKLSYEQFIILMFNRTGSIDETLKIISEHKFKDEEQVFKFVNKYYSNTNKIDTVTKDYPDVTRRLMIISGFITIRYEGIKFIEINENKLDYIKELLSIEFDLTDEEKYDAKKYFLKLNSNNEQYLNIVKKYRITDKINGNEYTNKIYNIISQYNIDEEKITKSIYDIGTKNSPVIPEFNEIPSPLKLEFYISILIALKYKNEFVVRPNYKVDHIGKPYSHAPGNYGDIDVYSDRIYWLIEVTLIRNKTQLLNNETSNIIRHLNSNEEFKNYSDKYLSLIAPVIHEDTKEFFDVSLIKNQAEGKKIHIKPYNMKDFLDITLEKSNFSDMEDYSKKVFTEFKSKLSK